MKVIEVIPGQGILNKPSSRPEIEILTGQFERHDRLVSLIPGFIPDAVSPYSFGIFAASAITGAISRDTAFTLARMRADIVREAESKKPAEERSAMGVMLASRDTIATILAKFPTLQWTNDNGPGAHVLGGSIRELQALAEEAGRKFRGILTAEGAYHSSIREEDAVLFREKIDDMPIGDPQIPVIPSTGDIAEINTAKGLKDEMAQSMYRQVKLEDIVRYWSQKGYDAVFDLSNGGTIQQLVTRFNTSFQFSSLEEEVEKIREFFSHLKTQLPGSNLALP